MVDVPMLRTAEEAKMRLPLRYTLSFAAPANHFGKSQIPKNCALPCSRSKIAELNCALKMAPDLS